MESRERAEIGCARGGAAACGSGRELDRRGFGMPIGLGDVEQVI